MSALSHENPLYTIAYTVVATGKRVESDLRRESMVRSIRGWVVDVSQGRITDVKVTNRFGDDVTLDWFG